MSGVKLPIDPQCAHSPKIYVGASAALQRVLPKLQLTGPESYVTRFAGADLVLAGGAPRGTLYAVYGLLDRLGCRWFTADASRIPKSRTITLPDKLDVREGPAFEYREPFFTEAADRNWAVRNRTNGATQNLDASVGGRIEYFPFVHSFLALVPPEKYFKDHPEYFSLIDGARRAERSQLCLTNPDVLKIAVAQVRQWIHEHPAAKIVSVSQNDWTGWCECDRCRRVEQEEGDRHSGPLLRFVNAVAGEIEKTNPDVLIDTLAYWYTEDPPAQVRPRPNVRIRLCPIGVCESHPYGSCPRSAYFARNLEAWSKITNQLYIWHYNTNFSHYVSPFPDFHQLEDSIRLYKKSGVVGLFMEGGFAPGGGAENAELRSYVMARLMWNPSVDVNREVDDFLNGVYGPAAKPMRQYYDLVQSYGEHIWVFNLPEYSDSFLDQARGYLERALEAAPDDAIRARVKKAAAPVDYVQLVKWGEYQIRDGMYGPADTAGFQKRWHEFTDNLKRMGIHNLRESTTIEQDAQHVDEMGSYAVESLENSRWQVAVVPALSGRVVQMIDRKTGKDILRKPRVGEGYIPNVGGQVLEVYPDYPLKPFPIEWHTTLKRSDEVVLLGSTQNGLQVTRRIRLDGDAVRVEASVQNASNGPVELVLQTRADLEPGDIDAARVRYQAEGGQTVNRTVLTPGQQPSGSDTVKGGEVPKGEWLLERAGLTPVVNGFERGSASRTYVSYTAKGGPRVTLGVWSGKKTLAAGEKLELVTSYR